MVDGIIVLLALVGELGGTKEIQCLLSKSEWVTVSEKITSRHCVICPRHCDLSGLHVDFLKEILAAERGCSKSSFHTWDALAISELHNYLVLFYHRTINTILVVHLQLCFVTTKSGFWNYFLTDKLVFETNLFLRQPDFEINCFFLARCQTISCEISVLVFPTTTFQVLVFSAKFIGKRFY